LQPLPGVAVASNDTLAAQLPVLALTVMSLGQVMLIDANAALRPGRRKTGMRARGAPTTWPPRARIGPESSTTLAKRATARASVLSAARVEGRWGLGPRGRRSASPVTRRERSEAVTSIASSFARTPEHGRGRPESGNATCNRFCLPGLYSRPPQGWCQVGSKAGLLHIVRNDETSDPPCT
jgi:hypothetical protein